MLYLDEIFKLSPYFEFDPFSFSLLSIKELKIYSRTSQPGRKDNSGIFFKICQSSVTQLTLLLSSQTLRRLRKPLYFCITYGGRQLVWKQWMQQSFTGSFFYLSFLLTGKTVSIHITSLDVAERYWLYFMCIKSILRGLLCQY